MSETVSLREANQNLARYVRAVADGQEFVITRRGVPVARLIPVAAKRVLTPRQELARRRSLERMQRGWDLGGERAERSALHER